MTVKPAINYNPRFLQGAFMAKDSFEKDLKRLEDIVSKMEEGDIPLDESMKLFEEGIKLSRLCSERLDKAEKKVEIITADKNGNITTSSFEAENQ